MILTLLCLANLLRVGTTRAPLKGTSRINSLEDADAPSLAQPQRVAKHSTVGLILDVGNTRQPFMLY
jgi:hypothetical protein